MAEYLNCQELSKEQIEMFLGEACKAIRQQYPDCHFFCELLMNDYNRLSTFLGLENVNHTKKLVDCIRKLDEDIIVASSDNAISHLILTQLQILWRNSLAQNINNEESSHQSDEDIDDEDIDDEDIDDEELSHQQEKIVKPVPMTKWLESCQWEKHLESVFKKILPKILEKIESEANQSLAKKRFHPENENAKPSFKELFWSYRMDWDKKSPKELYFSSL